MFLFKKRDSGRRKTIERLYGAIVAQSRAAVFYLDMGVPDTVEGRFDLLVLHMHLVSTRSAQEGEAGVALGQELLDRFFEDMDASLREIGIGDLKVPKEMRTLAEAYLGRSAQYAPAIAKGDEAALTAAIARNIYAKENAAGAGALAAYAIATSKSLNRQPLEQFLNGRVVFSDPVKAAVHEG
jgi:cytochrome b pre-mRNA-processing protein 3